VDIWVLRATEKDRAEVLLLTGWLLGFVAEIRWAGFWGLVGCGVWVAAVWAHHPRTRRCHPEAKMSTPSLEKANKPIESINQTDERLKRRIKTPAFLSFRLPEFD